VFIGRRATYKSIQKTRRTSSLQDAAVYGEVCFAVYERSFFPTTKKRGIPVFIFMEAYSVLGKGHLDKYFFHTTQPLSQYNVRITIISIRCVFLFVNILEPLPRGRFVRGDGKNGKGEESRLTEESPLLFFALFTFSK